MTNLPNKQLFRPDEVAEYFSVTRTTIYNWINEGKLKAVKVSRLTRIQRDSILKMQKLIEIY